MISRLRAVLTSSVLLLFLAVVLMLFLISGRIGETSETELERRIAETLSSMSDVGKVKVVISTRVANTNNQASGIYNRRMDSEIPCGVVAVAEGADDPVLQAKIVDALCALLGLPASAVSVVSGGE